MPTLAAARELIYEQFLNNYTGLAASAITADNEKFDPPVEAAWGRFSVRHTGRAQESLGGVGLRKFTSIGSAFFQIFTPENQGTNEADLLAEEARDLLEGLSLDGTNIRFTNASVTEIGVKDGWYGLVVEGSFEYTEAK